MRYKLPLPKLLQWLIFCGYIAFILRVIIENKLGFFVNPTYKTFILAMCLIGIAFALAALYVFLRKKAGKQSHTHKQVHHQHTSDNTVFGLLDGLVLIILLSTATIVTQPLLSRAALQRANVNTSKPLKLDVKKLDPQNPQGFLEWTYFLEKEGQRYVGKEVSLLGFVSPIYKTTETDTFALTRFFISCCAVDAAPLDIPVAYSDWKNNLQQDQWVRVIGVVAPISVEGKERYGIVASEVVSTEQPSDPYVYRE